MKAAFVCPASHQLFPMRHVAAACHDPRAESVVQNQNSYHDDWKRAQVKIPASNSSELWREVLTLDQELTNKRFVVFFPECLYPLLMARLPGPVAVIKKAIPVKHWGIQKLIRIMWMLNLNISLSTQQQYWDDLCRRTIVIEDYGSFKDLGEITKWVVFSWE